jgi:BASS family bile acid:Na+ symporter
MGYLWARPGLLIKSLLSVDVLVPLIAIAVIILVRPAKATAIGLLILAASPVAPMVLKKISQAGGNREYALSLHVALASLAIVTTPVTIALLSDLAGLDLKVDPFAVAGQVGVSVLLPIIAGLIVGGLIPAAARRIIRPLETISDIITAIVVIVVLLFTYQTILTMDIASYVAIALMIAGALLAGHLMAWGRPEEQTTLALESATRNIGLSLLIASAFTTLDKALPVLIPYLIISAIIGLIYVRYRKMGRGAGSNPETH